MGAAGHYFLRKLAPKVLGLPRYLYSPPLFTELPRRGVLGDSFSGYGLSRKLSFRHCLFLGNLRAQKAQKEPGLLKPRLF